MVISWPWGGSQFQLTDPQYKAGMKAVEAPEATHFKVFSALKNAGVPVRENGRYPASQIATALQELKLREHLA